jgi:biopolymer transport protein ExbB
MEFWDFFQRGGIAMYPILFCSIMAVGVFLERLWALRGNKLIPQKFVQAFQDEVRQGKLKDAAELCDRHASAPIARVARAGLAQHGRGADMIKFTVSENGAQEALALERHQYILSTVAYLCPLLGLFGTVSGMIKAFEVISHHTVVDPPLLAAGISEALITTYAGLAVAIPAVVMDRYVQSRADALSQELEKQSAAITQELILQSSEERSLKLLASSTR